MADSTYLQKEVYYYGKEGRQPDQIALSAGSLRMIYEAGNLRYLRLGRADVSGREVVRMIYPTVRDRNWGTILPEIRNERIEKQTRSFRISFENHYNTGDIQYIFRCSLEGKPDGTVRYEVDGEALSTFQKNRLGICLLHPIPEHAGKPCEVTQPDGTKYTGKFPVDIQVDQPFKNIRTMRWEVAPECHASITFAGEVFETEDQRNYGDASYKTYCTPQDRPKPAEIKQGEHLWQSVELKLEGKIPEIGSDKTPLQFTVAEQTPYPVPALGVSRSSEVSELSETEIRRIKDLQLAHYRVDVVPAKPNWTAWLQSAVREARQLNLPLEVMFYPGDNAAADAEAFLRECPSERTRISSITIFRSGDLSSIIRTFKEGYPNTPVGTGASRVFIELNRSKPDPAAEFVAYPVCPQIHLFDNTSVIENLAGQAYTVESALQLANGKPVHLSSVTLKPAAHPVTETYSGEQLPRQSDVRQLSLFGAACTVGSLKALSEAGATSATYYETVGTQGLMQAADNQSSVAPAVFKAPKGSVYPAYYVLQQVGQFGKGRVIRSSSNQPLVFDGLVLGKEKAKRILLTNYTGKEQSVRVGPLKGSATVRLFDETTVQTAMMNPEAYLQQPAHPLAISKGYATLRLKPYATVTMDVRE